MKVEQAVTNNTPAHLQDRMIRIARAVNGQLEFGSPATGPINMSGSWVNITTPGANVEFTVTHTLGRVPTGILVASLDQAAIIYASRKTSWTTTQAFFKCNVATVALQGFVI